MNFDSPNFPSLCLLSAIISFQTCSNKCDVIKQNQSEVGNIDFKIEPKKSRECLLFPIVFDILKLLISLEPIDQFQWGFLQNVAVKMVHTVIKMKAEFDRLQTDFAWSHHKCILYVLLFHKCIKIKYKTVNMYGVFLWLVQSSSRWNTIHSHRNYHVPLSVRVGEFCHPARSR